MAAKEKVYKILLTVFMAAFGIVCIFPFIFMISSSFKISADVMKFPFHLIPERFTMDNFVGLFTNGMYQFPEMVCEHHRDDSALHYYQDFLCQLYGIWFFED